VSYPTIFLNSAQAGPSLAYSLPFPSLALAVMRKNSKSAFR
jgi:hypothetical protein